jgi:hypothetical protein
MFFFLRFSVRESRVLMQTMDDTFDSTLVIDGERIETKEPQGRPIKQGWLKKKSPKGFGGFKKWQARFFILYNNQVGL